MVANRARQGRLLRRRPVAAIGLVQADCPGDRQARGTSTCAIRSWCTLPPNRTARHHTEDDRPACHTGPRRLHARPLARGPRYHRRPGNGRLNLVRHQICQKPLMEIGTRAVLAWPSERCNARGHVQSISANRRNNSIKRKKPGRTQPHQRTCPDRRCRLPVKTLASSSCPLRARSGESWRRLTVTRGQTSQDAADQRLSR